LTLRTVVAVNVRATFLRGDDFGGFVACFLVFDVVNVTGVRRYVLSPIVGVSWRIVDVFPNRAVGLVNLVLLSSCEDNRSYLRIRSNNIHTRLIFNTASWLLWLPLVHRDGDDVMAVAVPRDVGCSLGAEEGVG
jgi:hypothetical protein